MSEFVYKLMRVLGHAICSSWTLCLNQGGHPFLNSLKTTGILMSKRVLGFTFFLSISSIFLEFLQFSLNFVTM